MNRPHGRRAALPRALRLATAAASLTAAAAMAAPETVSTDDLQAAARTLQFVDSLPHNGTLSVGMVYASDRTAADEVAHRFAALGAPNAARFEAVAIPAEELERFPGRLDLLFLLPGTAGNARAILDAVHARHVLSISSDPACLDAHCCVLMVHSGERTDVVLDTGLADAAGAHFSTVFTMMVKRR